MRTKNTSRILWGSLGIGICFDILFWKQAPGISFFVFMNLTLLAGFIFAGLEGIKPAKSGWILAGLVIYFSAMTFFREEPFTTFINGLLALTSLGLLALTFSSGFWLRYSVADVVTGLIRLIGAALVGGSTMLATPKPTTGLNGDKDIEKEPQKIPVWALIRGVLLALPVVVFLALLLASADPMFSKELDRILNIDLWLEYSVRAVIIAVIGYLVSGIYLYIVQKSQRTDLIGLEKPWFPTFLGFTESTVILGFVNLLFAFFVAVQFKYFFGGQANIHLDGYTFAEYARKGFGELITVAFFSLVLYLGLSAITVRDGAKKQKWFAGLGVGLLALVVVILISSFYRLNLLEDAYGFSRLRTYSHVFMVWLGVLLAAIIGLEIANYRRGFAMAAFLTLIGFGITLNVLNVDAFILYANVQRAERNGNLDFYYLQELSNDSVPAGLARFRTVKDQETKHLLGAALVCRMQGMQDQSERVNWQGYHYSFYSAFSQLQSAQDEFKEYQYSAPEESRYGAVVSTPIGERECYSNRNGWD